MSDEAPTAVPETGQGPGTTSDEGWLRSIPDDLTFEETGEDGKPVAKPLREHPKIREFKDAGALAKSYVKLQQQLGGPALTPLPADASEEERGKWDAKLRELKGVPKSPEDYQLDLPPEWETTDPGMLDWFKREAHARGMTTAETKGFLESFFGYSKEYWDRRGAEMEAAKAENIKAIAEHFGGGTKAEASIDLARRGFVAAAARAGVSAEDAEGFAKAYGDDLTFLRVFHHIGVNMNEDDIAAPNMSKGGKGGNENLVDTYAKVFKTKGA